MKIEKIIYLLNSSLEYYGNIIIDFNFIIENVEDKIHNTYLEDIKRFLLDFKEINGNLKFRVWTGENKLTIELKSMEEQK